MKKRNRTTTIVIHRAEVWTGKDYHFVVLRDGTQLDLVLLENKGQHALKANAYSIGIAFQGCFTSGIKAKFDVPTEAQYESGKQLIRGLEAIYGPLKIIRHSNLGADGTTHADKLVWETSCPGDKFDMGRLK